MSMDFIFSFFSFGFIGRFIIAFIILAFLHSSNKNDEYIRNGFKLLCILGAVVLVLFILLFLFLFFFVGVNFWAAGNIGHFMRHGFYGMTF